jgi:hypothetical protein
MTDMAPMFSRKLFAAALLSVVLFQSECLAQGQGSGANPKAPVPPTLPPVPSPIQYFRRLLDSPAAEREQLLAGKSPEHRRVLTNSVRTYLALSPEDRESRLRAMELRFYLTPLMQLPATNRALGLQTVPESFRALVQERLDYWDRLAPQMRQQLLDSDRLLRVTGSGLLTPVPPTLSLSVRGYTSNQLAAMDAAAKQWQSYSVAKRDEIAAKFERLFSVTPEEKDKTLRQLPLSETERGQIQRTLERFAGMQPVQRQVVVKSFGRLAGLSPEERRQFLRNAESWQKMSPEDRQRWRHLVNNLPPLPPLPPGFGQPLMPPLPKAPVTAPRQILADTNGPRF